MGILPLIGFGSSNWTVLTKMCNLLQLGLLIGTLNLIRD